MNLQDAARLLGVHYQTAYRWVRSGELSANKHGTMYEVSEADLRTFVERRRQPTPPPDRLQVRTWSGHVDRLARALAAGEERSAWALVERFAGGGVPVLEICENLLGPALVVLDARLSNGELAGAYQRRAIGICARLIARLQVHPRGRPRGTAVIVTAPDDPHEIPALMAAVVLRADRWKVHHIAGQVIARDTIGLAHDVAADVVVISATADPVDGVIDKYVSEIEREGFPVLVGHRGSRLRDLLAAARAHAAAFEL